MTVTAQATFVATLVDEWARAGVTDAVVAPGSRSTPLTLALAGDPRLRVHVHLDERVAGFFALGLGLATGRPAVVVTTSGTAAVELHAAVVEASQARVPLLVCTADRPPELHHVAAPQTVEQARLFGDVVRWFVEPGAADGLPREWWRSIGSRLVAEAVASPLGPGPVHANLAFRDPLVGEAGPLPAGRADGAPWHAVSLSRQGEPFGEPFFALWPRYSAATAHSALEREAGTRGVVVAGWRSPEGTIELAERLRWPILADPRSGVRGRTDNAVAAFDAILRVDGLPHPDVVLRVGAPPASKVMSQWIAALGADGVPQLIVDPHGGWPDPERQAMVRLLALPSGADITPADGSYLAWWQRAEANAQRAIDAVLDAHAAPSEPGTVRRLTRELPPDTLLFVSSSMPVRDIEWFGDPSSTHRVLSNRGANGIDGVVATAMGVAAADPSRPVVAVVGDLAFLYDSSALLWARGRDLDLTIVVLDNDGGGIFSFLPQRDVLPADHFERFFGTPHGVDIAALAAVHGIPVVDEVGEGTGVRLVLMKTERDANVALHAALNAAVAAAVESG